MSATINSEIFKNYFNDKDINFGEILFSGTSNYNIE